jgi:hypothetical protein
VNPVAARRLARLRLARGLRSIKKPCPPDWLGSVPPPAAAGKAGQCRRDQRDRRDRRSGLLASSIGN